MIHQGSKVIPRRTYRVIRALHGIVFLYALVMFFLNAAPAFDEAVMLTQKQFWISLGISLPFLAASGVAFFSLATDTFHGTSLCLCFFVLLTCLMLIPDVTQSGFMLFIGLILVYGASVFVFFRGLRDKWAEHVAMRSYAHKTSFLKYK